MAQKVCAFAGERTRRIYSSVSPVVRLKMNLMKRYYRDVLELSTIFTDKKRATISRSPAATTNYSNLIVR